MPRWLSIVDQFLQGKYTDALRGMRTTRLSNTSITSARKVHGMITLSLERVRTLLSGVVDETRKELAKQLLMRSIILVNYLAERDVLDRDFANAISGKLESIIANIDGRKYQVATELSIKLRIFLDAIIAFKYKQLKG